jgi:isoprenylcysteine carboxyl methyltransferase (ICMT) family protein YpbQ
VIVEPYMQIVIPLLWLVWLIYWIVSARDVKRSQWHESLWSEMRWRLPLILAGIIFAAPRWVPRVLTRRFLPVSGVLPPVGAILVAAGLGLAVWARRHLGRNWSAQVQVKEDHALIRTGPYRRVRHPIYTGILLAFLGMAVAIGEWRGLVALLFATVSFAMKAKVEERRMLDTFPEYAGYRQESSALVPFVY